MWIMDWFWQNEANFPSPTNGTVAEPAVDVSGQSSLGLHRALTFLSDQPLICYATTNQ